MNAAPELAELAQAARRLAAEAVPGSMDRRAYGCVYVAAATSRTLPSARRVLASVRPPSVRSAALARFAELATRPGTARVAS